MCISLEHILESKSHVESYNGIYWFASQVSPLDISEQELLMYSYVFLYSFHSWGTQSWNQRRAHCIGNVGFVWALFSKPLFHDTSACSLLKQLKWFLVISFTNGDNDACNCFFFSRISLMSYAYVIFSSPRCLHLLQKFLKHSQTGLLPITTYIHICEV